MASSGDRFSDQFPAGLRVLVVDDDPTCLKILEKMLRNCHYEATKCNRAEVALSLLRENRNAFDIVISDVHMPDMDGFKLLEHIGLEMGLQVIMMSVDDSKSVVIKGVTHGACDYLIKPVRIEALRNIWQHVVRKRKQEWKDFESSESVEDLDRQQKTNEDADERRRKSSSKRRKDEAEERDDSSSSTKKPRLVWSSELHHQFVDVVCQLGIDKAVPKKILEVMNVPGLTRTIVASHLQKYRLSLRKLSKLQHQGGLNKPFMENPDPSFGSMSSLNGLDLQTQAASGQIQAQSLVNLQELGRPGCTKSPISMPLDQRNLLGYENPNFQFGEGHSKQMNLMHGIPTNMEPKQLANVHQSAHSFGALGNQVNSHGSQNSQLLIPMGQSQSQSRPSNQAMLPKGIGSGILARNGLGDNVRVTGNNPGLQSSSIVDFSSKVNSEVKVTRGVIPSYDIFSELNQHTYQDWGFQNVGLTFDAFQHTNTRISENFGQEDLMISALLKQQEGIGSAESDFVFD